MTEAIIGREHGTNRLVLTIAGKPYPLSPQNSVPKTVSSAHCRLQVDDDGSMTLSNIKSQLNTYVNGIQINSKHITFDSQVELGSDHFRVDMSALRQALHAAVPRHVSIAHLEAVWNQYEEDSKRLVLQEQKLNNIRNLQGVFMTTGVVVMLLPQLLGTEFPPVLNYLRFALSIPAIIIPLYFFWRGRDASKSMISRQNALKEKLQKEYVCPQCKRFMGYAPYYQLKFTQRCVNPECACTYTNK